MTLIIKSTTTCLLLSLFCSCGKAPDKKQDNNFRVTESILPDGTNVMGAYVAKLWPVNTHLDLEDVGSAAFHRKDDTFAAYVHLKNGTPSTWHKQGIYTGTRCPNLTDDLNQDAYIDYEEAKAAMNHMLIPLDEDINSQSAGKNKYPTANEEGIYFFEREASFDKMFADLKTEDENPNDNIVKLREEEGLRIEGKVVIIQGVADSTFLPNSVGAPYGSTAQRSLPVACGIIYKSFAIPGELGEAGEESTATRNGPANTSTSPDENSDRPHEEDAEATVRESWFERLRNWFRSHS